MINYDKLINHGILLELVLSSMFSHVFCHDRISTTQREFNRLLTSPSHDASTAHVVIIAAKKNKGEVRDPEENS